MIKKAMLALARIITRYARRHEHESEEINQTSESSLLAKCALEAFEIIMNSIESNHPISNSISVDRN